MKIKVMQLGMIGTNCYIFWEEGDRRCGIVDPGDSGEQVAAWIQDQGLEREGLDEWLKSLLSTYRRRTRCRPWWTATP